MIVVGLTLAAAALSALSAAGEHRVAARLAGRARTRSPALGLLAGAVALVASPLWLASWAVDALGYLLQAAALHLGSLTVVQPLMVTTLLFTLPLAALGARRRAGPRDWAGVAAVALGLAAVLGTRDAAGPPSAPTGALVPAMALLTILVAVLVVLAHRRRGTARAALLAVAAGALFAVGAAVTKLTAATAVSGGLVGLLTTWPGYALAAVSVASFGLQQAAYAAGPLATVMTAAVITDPLTSYALGVVGFGEPLPVAGAPLAISALGMLTLGLGVAALAPSPLLRRVASTRRDTVRADGGACPAGSGGVGLRCSASSGCCSASSPWPGSA